ncbi:uncharacterized protein LOC132202312 [Neocloeon triangulifer]|uniref:uncharacterized protein LOC132202312 n=1 Tax=Neocloeon triangulifer TaxID=2078957 RepID=UPI00286F0B3D|nr:uncharacterized protein LOC132202312 [Neocloeon triangulifer]
MQQPPAPSVAEEMQSPPPSSLTYNEAVGQPGHFGWNVRPGPPVPQSEAGGADVWKDDRNGGVPLDAFVGGYDNERKIYVGRAHFKDGLIPGKVVPQHGKAFIPWGCKEHALDSYEVLCGNNGKYDWMPTTIQREVPSNAVIGGYSEGNRDTLYICRIVTKDGNHAIGKVHHRCENGFVPYGGKELNTGVFEILVRLF